MSQSLKKKKFDVKFDFMIKEKSILIRWGLLALVGKTVDLAAADRKFKFSV